MKHKTLLMTLLCSALAAGSATAAEGDTATVQFHGQLVAAACKFDTGSENKSVDLGVHTVNYLNTGNQTPKTDFSLNITGCTILDNQTAATPTASGVPVNLVKLNFKDSYYNESGLTGALVGRKSASSGGELSNVGIHVSIKDELELDFSSGAVTKNLSDVIDSNKTTLNFKAWMGKTHSDAPAGDVYGEMTVEFEYL